MKCGKPVRFKEQELCFDCQKTQHSFDEGRALWLHRAPVNLSIYRFKFHNQRRFAIYYTEEMYRKFRDTIRRWRPDYILPVPLHIKKYRARGYNQAELLCAELSRMSGVPTNSLTLRRKRRTSPQKSLDPFGRKQNLCHAFEVCEGKKSIVVKGRKLLIVDDIFTTGSTMDAIAETLKKAGAEKVYYLTISIGQGY